MSIKEQVFVHNGVSVKYKLQDAVSDRKHLVVIFSGFDINYDFSNVARSFRCNVLWIKDDYEGNECYCLGKNGGFEFSVAVNELIESILLTKKLVKSECTLLGSSKGGFVSLFMGIKYQYKNIISSVFTSLLGDRMTKLRPNVGDFVMGRNDQNVVDYYNNLLKNTIYEDDYLDRNIYLFTSEADNCYANNQVPIFPYLQKYKNLNIVKTDSHMVFRHNTITAYNVPLIVSFINSIVENVVPQFRYLENGNKLEQGNVSKIKKETIKPVTILKSCSIEKDILYIDGDAFFLGIPCPKYNLYKKTLILINQKETIRFSLGTTLDPLKSNKYFSNEFIDYSAAGFATPKYSGIDISNIPEGTYDVKIELQYLNKYKRMSALQIDKLDQKFWNKDEFEYRCWCDSNGNVKLSKRCLLQPTLLEPYFNLSQLVVKETTLFIEGEFVVPGIEAVRWDDVQYYLIIHSADHKHIFALGKLHKEKLNELIDYGFGVYQKSSFCSYNQKGINISSINKGTYTLTVLQSYKGCMFSHIIDKNLIVEDSEYAYIE